MNKLLKFFLYNTWHFAFVYYDKVKGQPIYKETIVEAPFWLFPAASALSKVSEAANIKRYGYQVTMIGWRKVNGMRRLV